MSGKATLTALKNLQVGQHRIPAFNNFPNTSIQGKPLLIYHSAFQTPSASQIESHLSSIGVVTPAWRYTMYSTSHFHSNNPGRVEREVQKGDVIVVPAGVAHRLLEDKGGFSMVGSYPGGKSWDICYGREEEADKVGNIKHLGWFDKDPIYGDKGPVLDVS
ncbi:hypothetical protein GJ744_001032 [Endocarpon pusillum]|uniref:Cupin type-1 domain-containing protein n=1 Tax=Endocarpon pusillum TaxID=364733 RepID=A0A8H7DZS7_9EURO|nr:hypothetical protein GJ744_001032 [Endocarpon pusillum]